MSTSPRPERPADTGADADAPTLSRQDARSGETSGHVRTILGVSMALTVIGLGVLVLVWTAGA